MRHSGFLRGLRRGPVAIAALVFLLPPVQAQEAPRAQSEPATPSPVGEYLMSQMELVAGIRLDADGTFEYGLTVGALDESAHGRWEAAGNRIKLTSTPRPVPPEIAPAGVETWQGPFALRVLSPNGRDVPGVDLRIEFDRGEPLDSYMAGGPWSLPEGEKRVPRFVTFSMPSSRLQSGRLPLAPKPGRVATFTLTPNDFGVIDLSGVHAEIVGEMLVLHRPEGAMRFKRVSR